MFRYLSKRLLAIHFTAILAIGICIWLSAWQWNRAHYVAPITKVSGVSDFNQLSPLRDYLPPTSVGVPTKVEGTWQENSRIEFTQRPADGTKLIKSTQPMELNQGILGTWVLDVLILQDGSSLAVVSGWTQKLKTAPAFSGTVELSGVMQPSEDALSISLTDLPSYITTKEVLKISNSTMHDGYFISTTQIPGFEVIKPILPNPVETKLHWRNVIYTFNWGIFGIIIFGMWWRIIQDEVKLQTKEQNDRN